MKRSLTLKSLRQLSIRKRRQTSNVSHTTIHSLPPEIISKIFEDVVLGDAHPFFKLHFVCIGLCLVCKEWQQIAYATPQLWAELELGSTSRRVKFNPSGIDRWMARSGTCPLTIRLTSSSEIRQHMKDVINVITDYSTRWARVELNIDILDLEHLMKTISKNGGLPALQTIHVVSQQDDMVPTSYAMDLSSAVNTSVLQLRGKIHARISQSQTYNFRSLKIEVHTCIHDVLTLVERSPHLSSLKIRIPEIGNEACAHTNSLTTALILKHLDTLHVTSSRYNTTTFLRRFIVPGLSDLCLYSPNAQDNVWDNVGALMRRSQCHIQVLSICGASSPKDEVIECLQSAPSLRVLHIGGLLAPITVAALSDTDGIIPLLEEIYFDQCPDTEDMCDALVEMIANRWEVEENGQRSLKAVNVRSGMTFKLRQYPEMLKYIEEGLDVGFTTFMRS